MPATRRTPEDAWEPPRRQEADREERAGAPEGARIGPYRLVERLGEGGMGVVHLGIDASGRGVAVKVLRDHVAHDEVARSRLAREFSTLRRVRHPLVAPVLGADLDGARPYLATRYVPGPPLDEWVHEHGPLAGRRLLDFGRDLADALAAIHAAGVVHRDLKPGNVLVLDGRPVVIDFGIAHAADDTRLTRTGLVMGTPGYLPPELLDGDAVGESTDWWGWAATLAYAATGRAPFGGGPMDAIFHRVYRGDADLDGVDPRLAALLRACFDPDPRRRPDRDRILAGLDAVGAGADATEALAPPGRGEDTTVSTAGDATETLPAAAPRPAPAREDAAPTRAQAVTQTRRMPAVRPPAASPGRPTASPERQERQERVASYAGFTPGGPARGDGHVVDDDAPVPHAGALRRRRVRPVLLAGTVFLAALAATFPLITVFVCLGWSVIARTVDASILALATRREGRGGAHAMDVPRVVGEAPLRLVPALLTSLLLGLGVAIVAVASLFATTALWDLTGAGTVEPFEELPLSVAALVSVVVAWWGPGGRGLRHGSRRTVAMITPGRYGPLVLAVGLALVAGYLALYAQASGVVPSWTPASGFHPSQLLPTW